MLNLTEEYRTATIGAGWHDARGLGRLRFEGRDTTAFLHALLTADIEGVAPGRGTYAAYLTPQGRMITDLALYRHADHWLAVVPAGLAPALVARFDSVIFAEDARVSDVSSTVGQVTVVGPAAADAIARALGADPHRLRALTLREHVDAEGVTVARTDAALVPSFDVLFPADRASAVTALLTGSGAVAIDAGTLDTLRIEAGHPRFGVDMTTETIPLEAGLLERAISETKGCYVGQEIIVRVLHRGGGRVAKRLMRIEAADGVQADPAPVGAALVVEDREVGQITSAAWSPGRSRVVALGYVHRDSVEAKDIAIRSAGHESRATIVGPAG
jgi:folate-binding protein YgfZ